MVVLGALTAAPMAALAIGIGFGLVRGLAVLMTRNLAGPAELRALPSPVRRCRDRWWAGRSIAVELVAPRWSSPLRWVLRRTWRVAVGVVGAAAVTLVVTARQVAAGPRPPAASALSRHP